MNQQPRFMSLSEIESPSFGTQDDTPTKLATQPGFSHFSWTNDAQIVESLWLISRALKNLILTIFRSILVAFMEEHVFGSLYSVVLKVCDSPGLWLLLFLFILFYLLKWWFFPLDNLSIFYFEVIHLLGYFSVLFTLYQFTFQLVNSSLPLFQESCFEFWPYYFFLFHSSDFPNQGGRMSSSVLHGLGHF